MSRTDAHTPAHALRDTPDVYIRHARGCPNNDDPSLTYAAFSPYETGETRTEMVREVVYLDDRGILRTAHNPYWTTPPMWVRTVLSDITALMDVPVIAHRRIVNRIEPVECSPENCRPYFTMRGHSGRPPFARKARRAEEKTCRAAARSALDAAAAEFNTGGLDEVIADESMDMTVRDKYWGWY